MKSSNHAFFESFTKMIFRFLSQTDYESRKTKFDAKVTITVIFQVSEFRCEDHDDSDFSSQMRRSRLQRFFKLSRRSIFTQAQESRCRKIWVISKNFDAKKKTHVKHSKFKSIKHCESNFDKIISSNSIIEKINLITSTSNLRLNSTSSYFRIDFEVCVRLSRLIDYISKNL